jgi:hypothetical protein
MKSFTYVRLKHPLRGSRRSRGYVRCGSHALPWSRASRRARSARSGRQPGWSAGDPDHPCLDVVCGVEFVAVFVNAGSPDMIVIVKVGGDCACARTIQG